KAYFVDVGFQLGGDTRLQAWVMLLAATLNVVLNLLFIPRLGLLGAVYATVAVYVVSLLVSLWLVRRSFQLPRPTPILTAPLLATVVMAGLLLVLPEVDGLWSLTWQILAAGAVYLLCLAV